LYILKYFLPDLFYGQILIIFGLGIGFALSKEKHRIFSSSHLPFSFFIPNPFLASPAPLPVLTNQLIYQMGKEEGGNKNIFGFFCFA